MAVGHNCSHIFSNNSAQNRSFWINRLLKTAQCADRHYLLCDRSQILLLPTTTPTLQKLHHENDPVQQQQAQARGGHCSENPLAPLRVKKRDFSWEKLLLGSVSDVQTRAATPWILSRVGRLSCHHLNNPVPPYSTYIYICRAEDAAGKSPAQHSTDFKLSPHHFKHLCQGLWGAHKVNSPRWGWQAAGLLCGLFTCRSGKWEVLPNASQCSTREQAQVTCTKNVKSTAACQEKNSGLLPCPNEWLFICTAFIHLPQIPAHQIHTSSSLQVCATILPKYKLRAIKLKAIGTVSLKNKKCKPCQKGFAKSVALNIQNMSLVRGGGESKAKVQTWGLMYLV